VTGPLLALLLLFVSDDLLVPVVGDQIRYETARATVSFDAHGLTPDQRERFVRLVDKGIADIESYLREPPAERPRIAYQVRADIPISRTFRGTVELPLERVRTDTAPYLHETVHVLMRVRSRAMWLSEGFASFVQSWVAEQKGGYDGYVFSWGGNANVDRLARRHLARDAGKSVLPFVAGAGSPPEVWEERRQVAAPFYVMSHSFVKFIVENAGLATLKELLRAEDVSSTLERLTQKGLERWKADWLAKLESPR
jgi:hypothetical protein